MELKCPYIFTLMLSIWFLLSTSCQIRGSFKGLTSNREELERTKPNIIESISYNCESSNNKKSKIYIVNGHDLKFCISDYSKVLIYLWKPNCRSKACLDLELLQNLCDSINIELFIVAEYFDLHKMNTKYLIERPIFGIDTYFYKTNFTKYYVSKFLTDLTGKKLSYKESLFYLFCGPTFYKEGNQIEDVVQFAKYN